MASETIITRPSLALLPPMGWNSWNCPAEHPTEKAVREMADAMVSSGMKDAGYQYIVVDDFWEQGRVSKPERKVEERPGRDAQGILLAAPARFPSGFKSFFAPFNLPPNIHGQVEFTAHRGRLAPVSDCGSGV